MGLATTNIETIIPSDANPVAGWIDVPHERPAANDDEELDRRRRRREAMVLREGLGGPIGEDIIRFTNLDG